MIEKCDLEIDKMKEVAIALIGVVVGAGLSFFSALYMFRKQNERDINFKMFEIRRELYEHIYSELDKCLKKTLNNETKNARFNWVDIAQVIGDISKSKLYYSKDVHKSLDNLLTKAYDFELLEESDIRQVQETIYNELRKLIGINK